MKKIRVFVSSVQKEFAEERRAVKEFVHGDPLLGRFFEVFLFEDVPASSRSTESVFLREVDLSDIFVALLGSEYGRPGENGLSPTHREYRRATEQGKLKLIFLRGDDDSPRDTEMHALIGEIGFHLVRRHFGTTPELTAALYASLVEYLIDRSLVRVKPFDAVSIRRW